eukprot:4604362-Alexandrium_andersonii.AAC.1
MAEPGMPEVLDGIRNLLKPVSGHGHVFARAAAKRSRGVVGLPQHGGARKGGRALALLGRKGGTWA